jgi:hypothetical protein
VNKMKCISIYFSVHWEKHICVPSTLLSALCEPTDPHETSSDCRVIKEHSLFVFLIRDR